MISCHDLLRKIIPEVKQGDTQFYFCFHQLFCCLDKIPDTYNFKEKRFISAHGFRSSSSRLLQNRNLTARGACWRITAQSKAHKKQRGLERTRRGGERVQEQEQIFLPVTYFGQQYTTSQHPRYGLINGLMYSQCFSFAMIAMFPMVHFSAFKSLGGHF